MRLDHVSYACTPNELGDVVQRIGSCLGGQFADGGRHPRFGTRNFILPLIGSVYLEVVTALDHPAAEKAPFGRAVRACAESGGGWWGWAVAVDDVTPYEQRLGRAAVEGIRVRPDGQELRWHQIGLLDVITDPQVPYFTHWETDPDEHPSVGESHGIRLRGLEMVGDPERMTQWLGAPIEHPLGDVAISWRDAQPGDAPGLVAVQFDTPHGSVCID